MAECPPKRKSRMPNKICISLLIPVFIVCVVVAMLWGRQSTETFVADSKFETIKKPTTADFQNRVCTNQDCVSVAALIIQNMDQKADPCNDTVAFACGNYGLHHDPLTYYETSPTDDLTLQIKRQLTSMFKTPVSSSDKPSHALAKWYYQKCANQQAVDATAKKDLLAVLQEIGGWPLVDPNWTEFTMPWEEYLAIVYRKFQVEALISPSLELVDGLYKLKVAPKISDYNQSDYDNAASFLGAKVDPNHRDYEVFSRINSELKRLKTNTNWSYVQYVNFDPDKYVHTVLDGVINSTSPDFPGALVNSDYSDKLYTITSNKRDLANYVAGIVAIKLLSQPLASSFSAKIQGMDRSQKCYAATLKHFDVVSVQMFLGESGYRNFEDEVRPKANEMAELYKEVFQEMIRNATWLDEKTRQNALRKVKAMEYSFGYPEYLYNDTFYRKRYNIKPSNSSESYYSLAARIFEANAFAYLSQIGQPLDKMSYLLAPPVIPNAYYENTNKIYIHVAKFQLPFFSLKLPDYVNYAALGWTIGHEMMHAFGVSKRHYDEHNTYNPWPEEVSKKYEDRLSCFIKQFNDFGFDGKRTMNENIADYEGLVVAYHAYKKLLAKRPGYAEPALPGLENLTLDQIFFTIITSRSCSIRPTIGHNQINNYPPETFRALAPLQNFKQYSAALNCPKGAKMNPETKCSIW